MVGNCWGAKRRRPCCCRKVCAVKSQQFCRALGRKIKEGFPASLSVSHIETRCEVSSEGFWEAVTIFRWILHHGHRAGSNQCPVGLPRAPIRVSSAVVVLLFLKHQKTPLVRILLELWAIQYEGSSVWCWEPGMHRTERATVGCREARGGRTELKRKKYYEFLWKPELCHVVVEALWMNV